MAAYLLTFALSSCIIAMIQNWPKKSVGFVFWSVVALLLPCFLAGFRADTVGTDVLVYAKPMSLIVSGDISYGEFLGTYFPHLWSYALPSKFELGYAFMVWGVMRLTGNFAAVLFVTQALTVVPIYVGLLGLRDRLSPGFGMVIYYFVYFNLTLNMMRQFIAIGILILGLSLLLRGRWKAYLVAVLCACLFHGSAVIGLAFLALDLLFKKVRGREGAKIAAVSALCVLVLILINPIIGLLNSIGFSRYTGYIGTVTFAVNHFLMRLPVLCLLLWWWANGASGKNEWSAVLLSAFILDVAVAQFISAGAQSGRIAYYFGVSAIFSVPLALSAARGQFSKLVIGGGSVVFAVWYWVYWYVLSGSGETIPYSLAQGFFLG